MVSTIEQGKLTLMVKGHNESLWLCCAEEAANA